MKIYVYIPILLQVIMYPVMWVIFHTFLKLEVKGLDNITHVKGKLLFAVNHISELDPILVRFGLPMFWANGPMYYVARTRDGYANSFFSLKRLVYGGFVFKIFGAYPVYSGLRNYKKSLENFLHILQLGHSVCIFPEGKITDDEQKRPRGGVAYLAYTTGTPVVPVRIGGVEHLSNRKFFSRKLRVTITYGKPISPAQLFPKRIENIEEFTRTAETVMVKVKSLV